MNEEKVNLLFAKAKLLREQKKEIANINNDIVKLLDRWFDAHESELEEEFGDVICWGGDWYYLEGYAGIKLRFSVGVGEESYEESILLLANGHWEHVKTY